MCDGAGTDIVAVGRIEALLREHGDAFLQRWFTAAEISYCTAKAHPGRHLAARMAAKEAVLKALPFGWDGALPWRSIEIVPDPDGAPRVRLSGELSAVADRAGVDRVRVSLSHCDEYATAIALITLAVPDAGPGGRPTDPSPAREGGAGRGR